MGKNRRESDFCLGLAQLLFTLGKWDLVHPLILMHVRLLITFFLYLKVSGAQWQG